MFDLCTALHMRHRTPMSLDISICGHGIEMVERPFEAT